MNKLLMTIGAAAMAVGAFAAASTPPSTLVDLTTNGTDPSGSVDSYSSTFNSKNRYHGGKAFDGIVNTDEGSRWLPKKADNMWVIYKFNVPTVVDALRIYLPSGNLNQATRAPRDWTLQGSNDKSTWTVIDAQEGETDWSAGESRYYRFAETNTTAYTYYKYNCTTNNGDADCMQVLELEFYCIGGGNTTWTGGGATGLMNDVANWGGETMPGSSTLAAINETGLTPAVIPGGLTAYKAIHVGDGIGTNAKVVQTNGTFIVSQAQVTIGRAGGTGEYCISGGTLIATNSPNQSVMYIGAVGGSGTASSGIFDISGNATAWFNQIQLCTSSPSAGSTARLNISENASLSTRGQFLLGYVAASTTSTVYQTGGSINVGGNLVIGYRSEAYSEYLMSGGVNSFKDVFIGYGASTSIGLFRMTGGTCNSSGNVSIGRFGTGTFEITGEGTVLTADTVRVGLTYSGYNGAGTLVVTNGGEIAATQIYGGGTTVGQSTVTFDGAKLAATAANASFLKDLPNIALDAGGLTIDTQGYDIGIDNCTFNATGCGKITVTGGGTTTLSDVTLCLSEKPSRSYVFAETDGTFSGVPALTGVKGCSLELSDDSKQVLVKRTGFVLIFK